MHLSNDVNVIIRAKDVSLFTRTQAKARKPYYKVKIVMMSLLDNNVNKSRHNK
jgi:hypothetical protein